MRGALAFIALTIVMVSVWTMLRLPHRTPPPRATPSTHERVGQDDAGRPQIDDDATTADVETPTNDGARAETREAAAPAAADTATIVGRVVDEDGAAVAGATVRAVSTPSLSIDLKDVQRLEAELRAARDRPAAETTTDADGRFRLTTPRHAGFVARLSIAADGFVRAEASVEADHESRDGEVDAGVVTLMRGVVLEGRVVDANGAPIAGARVSWSARSEDEGKAAALGLDLREMFDDLRGLAPGAVTTGADGRFRLAHAESGPFTIVAAHDDRPKNRIEGDAPKGAHLRDLVVVLAEGRSLSGRVVGVKDGVGAITVHARRVAKRSAKSGLLSGLLGFDADTFSEISGVVSAERSVSLEPDRSFLLRGLARDEKYRIWATEDQGSDRVPCATAVEVGKDEKTIELAYDPGVEVTFRAVDGRDGTPLTKLTVTSEAAKRNSGIQFSIPRNHELESSDGRFTLPPLRAKDEPFIVDLRFTARGYQPLERPDVTLPRRGRYDLGVLVFESAPVVSVLVRDAATLAPIDGAEVTLHDPAAEPFPHERSSAGRAELTATPHQSVCVVVECEGYSKVVDGPFAVPAAGRIERTIDLSAGGTVRVLVLDAAGAPTAAEVQHRAPPDPAVVTEGGAPRIVVSSIASEESIGDSRETDADGLTTFDHLRPGTHWFRTADHVESSLTFSFGDDDEDAAPEDERWVVVDVADGALAEITLREPPAGTLFGVVREAGVPLEEATVKFVLGPKPSGVEALIEDQFLSSFFGQLEGLAGDGIAATTDRFGRYRLERLPVGRHRLRVSHDDRATPLDVEVEVVAGERECDVELDAATITGRVVDANGAPIAGARISLRRAVGREASDVDDLVVGLLPLSDDELATTGADGSFTLPGVPVDVDFELIARADGYAAATSEPFSVGSGRTHSVQLALGAAGSILVHAENVETSMLQAERLDVPEGAPPTKRVALIMGGVCEIKDLPPGRWRIVAGDSSREVVVTAGAVAELTLD